MRVLGLVPARGGSKGIPRKNLRTLAGRPLLAYTAEAALAARRLDRVILSTDDEEVADLGHRLGLEVPFLRPADLARDETPMLPVVEHALRSIEAREHRFDAVCLLQPTNPLRQPSLIDRCIERLETTEADAVVTVLPVPPEHNPHWVYLKDGSGYLRLATGEPEPIPRRQDLPPAFHREGSVYVTRRLILVETDSLYGERLLGIPVDPECSVNLDTEEDWQRAEELIGRRRATAAGGHVP